MTQQNCTPAIEPVGRGGGNVASRTGKFQRKARPKRTLQLGTLRGQTRQVSEVTPPMLGRFEEGEPRRHEDRHERIPSSDSFFVAVFVSSCLRGSPSPGI